MKTDNLISLWQEAHTEIHENNYDRISIEELASKKHSNAMTKVITDLKKTIFAYCTAFILFAGLWIYASGYLKLNLHLYSLIPFCGGGLFFLSQTITTILRFNILTQTAENKTIKESLLFFRLKVKRMRTIDFLSYLIFFYLLAIWLLYLYLEDIGGIKNIASGNEIQPLVIILLLLLLTIPWFMKYLNKYQYKKLYHDINLSTHYLEESL